MNNQLVRILAAFYSIIFLLMFLGGAGEQNFSYYKNDIDNKCTYPALRLEILFPGYQLGCWLATPIHGERIKVEAVDNNEQPAPKKFIGIPLPPGHGMF